MAKLSSAVMDDIADVINKYDKEGDGKVDVRDILSVLRALDLNPGSNDYDDVFEDYKQKKVDRISLEEFASLYEQESQRKGATHKELVEGIKALDPVNADSGLVSRAVLTRFLTVLGDKLTEQEAEKIITSTLEKRGKFVNIDEIVRLVMNPVEI